jgi:MFS family permease
VAEVPSGALADLLPRRVVIAAGELVRAAGYLAWTVLPTFWSFAAGFVLWGLGGACTSGATEALLYDELAVRGADGYLGTLLGRVRAASLLAQLPVAALATALFALGGYRLAGWASVAAAGVAAVLAARLPETARTGGREPYLPVLRAGLREARRGAVVGPLAAVALVAGLDAVEEYFPLLAAGWGVPAAAVPLAVLVIPLAGAAGASASGRGGSSRWGLLALAAGLLAAAAAWGRPAGLVGVAAGYGLYRLVLVRAEVRLQQRIGAAARATVTSVASLAGEITALLCCAAWTVGGLAATAVLVATVAVLGRVLDRVDFVERPFDS